MENKIKVFLHGALGKLFKKCWDLNVSSPREAVRAIDTNTGGKLKMFLLKNREIFYQIVFDDRSMSDVKQVDAKMENVQELHIVPHVVGASANTISLVGGAILLVAGAILTFGGVGAGAFAAAGVSLMLGGAVMLVSGIIGLLSPQPKPQEDVKKGGRSFLLDPSINTIKNGDPIPVAYGRLIIPGLSIDNRLETEDIDD